MSYWWRLGTLPLTQCRRKKYSHGCGLVLIFCLLGIPQLTAGTHLFGDSVSAVDQSIPTPLQSAVEPETFYFNPDELTFYLNEEEPEDTFYPKLEEFPSHQGAFLSDTKLPKRLLRIKHTFALLSECIRMVGTLQVWDQTYVFTPPDETLPLTVSKFPFPALAKLWLNRKAHVLHIFFRSPTIQVEDVIRNHEFYIVFGTIIIGVVWLFYSIYRNETYPDFHFDTLQLVPEALNGSFAQTFESGLRVLIGDQTSPIPALDTHREQYRSIATPICYCFSAGLVILLAIYEERPTIIMALVVLALMGVVSRLLQALHLSDDAAEELLCSFTRVEILQQEQQAQEEPTNYAATVTTHLEKTAMEAFKRDCRIAHSVSRRRYIQVGIFVGVVVVLVSVSDNVQRIIADNFEEFYSDSTTFSIIYMTPAVSFLIELFSNTVNLYLSFILFKIPMLSILTTSSQAQAASFFIQHFPSITPYAYPTRSPPEDPVKSVHLWDHARLEFLHRVNRQLNCIQRPADAFYACFLLLLAIMLLFSSQTGFFLYNEYGLAITTAALAATFVFLAIIWEGEKAYKLIHHDQETVFWDWWSGAALPSVEENLLTRPLPILQEGSATLSCVGIPLGPNATYIATVLLAWVWGSIFCFSVRCNEFSLQNLIGND